MEYLDISDQQTERLFKTCLANQSLIPIIGAGFTAGEKNKNGVVPNGDKFKELMISAITTNSASLSEHIEELKKRDFSQIAELYMNPEIVPTQQVKEDIQQNFLAVELKGPKKDFLEINWPYLYTLNIDDAIEKNSKYTAVLPYLNISEKSRSFGCVYKVHGDATHEVIYDEKSSLIFSSTQYIRSLIKNESMLIFLRTDLIENNILFIGCSLRNEVDLLFSIIGQDEEPSSASRRIYLTTSKPDPIRELDLKTYNINTVILVPDYETFYRKIIELSNDFLPIEIDPLEPFLFKNANVLNNEKNININFLLKSESRFNGHPHYLTVPYFAIERSVERNITESCMHNPITIINGKRYSGKSLILMNIARKVKQKNVYFFPSTVSVTQETINTCLSKENCFFIFDTNVLTYNVASYIRKNILKLSSKNSSVLIACNPTEIDVANTFAFALDGDFYIEVQNKFDQNEQYLINEKLSEIGIINFSNNKTILDNTFYLSREYPERKAKIINHGNLTNTEIKVLLIIAVFDKIYGSAARAIGLYLEGMKELAAKMHPILELEKTEKTEIQHHSHTKLSLNSKPWLFKVLSDFNKSNGTKQTSLLIKELVKSFISNHHFRYIQQKVIMFDTLNQIFSYEDGGAGALIKEVYITIQPLLSDNPDYWLQRAKSILKLERDNIKIVKDGIDYARKAFKDGTREKTINNAEFTIALLYGKLCKLENYAGPENVIEAINWFYTAISKNKYNKAYIDSMLEHSRNRRGPFHHLCIYLEYGEKDISLLQCREEVRILLEYYKQKDRTFCSS